MSKSFLLTNIVLAWLLIGCKSPMSSYIFFDNNQGTLASTKVTASSNHSHTAMQSGNFSDSSIWSNNQVPSSGATVYIPAGVNVIYDLQSNSNLDLLEVAGEVKFSTSFSTKLQIKRMLTHKNSLLQIGSSNSPLPSHLKSEIVFTSVGEGLIANGQIEVHGAAKSVKVALSGLAKKGDMSLKLESTPTNWKTGDRLLVLGTGTVHAGAGKSSDEVATIKSLSGNVVQLNSGLNYDHKTPDGLPIRTYVTNLSRNIVFQSATTGAGYIALQNKTTNRPDGTLSDIKFAQLSNMGATSIESGGISNPDGNYALVIRSTGSDRSGRHSHIEGLSIENPISYGIFQFDSRADLINNVVYKAKGAAIATGKGNEFGLWKGNVLASVVKLELSNVGHDNLLIEAVGFECQSRVIEIQDNVVSGVDLGYIFFGLERFEEDLLHDATPKEGIHRNMFDRAHMRFDPAPFDVSVDHEEGVIFGFNNNSAQNTGIAFMVFHRQMSDDTDAMSVIDNFTVWGGTNAIHLKNYASNYYFRNSIWVGDGTALVVERKTSAVVMKNIKLYNFQTGWESFGVNHESSLIDVEFNNIKNRFELHDLLRNVTDSGTRSQIIKYYAEEHYIDYENPMPGVFSSSNFSEINAVEFIPSSDADFSIGPNDSTLNIVGKTKDSIGYRRFNEYSIAKPPNGSGTSKDFHGITKPLTPEKSINEMFRNEISFSELLSQWGAYKKGANNWVIPVTHWVTDRLTGNLHPVIIEMKIEGMSDTELLSYQLASYPQPKVNHADFNETDQEIGNSQETSESPQTEEPTEPNPPDTETPTVINCNGVNVGDTGNDRIRYKFISVPYGEQCQSEVQTQTCQEDGNWSAYSGSFTSSSCTVDTATQPKPSVQYDTTQQGTFGSDTLHGGDNTNDHILGLGGSDKIDGGGGDDLLDGGEGDDTIIGGDGNDILIAGPGRDILRGKNGADTFVFDATALDDVDKIQLFYLNEGDKLDVSALLPNGVDLKEYLQLDDRGRSKYLYIKIDGSFHQLLELRDSDVTSFEELIQIGIINH